MPRPIWNGTLSFGLLQVPVQLMPGTRSTDVHFRMLDGRTKSPIRYERVNAETGEEVPWKEIVKAYEYAKGSYAIVDEKELKRIAPESTETIDIEAFVDADAIDERHFEKPYVLVPGKRADKGYVLLRETLRKTGKVGIARLVIRTRQYLAMLKPQERALILVLLRFPQELVDTDDYDLPAGGTAGQRINARELDMAAQLVDSMTVPWRPSDYKDEFRAKLHKIVEASMRKGGRHVARLEPLEEPAEAASNVVDFMSLLEQSLASGKRTRPTAGAAKSAAKSAAKPAANAAAKPAAKRKAKPAARKKTPAATRRRRSS
ncbi:Ku protein [Tahibacter caeni]|uniref:non-homologous end joining protein Ku n=1 Tax=Tahibacter caeni TaxID=1453545 RepID=UPI0021481F0E|nr:Ku protein [Tahibacter caeni]